MTASGQPRTVTIASPSPAHSAKAVPASRNASRSVTRPVTSAWLARGEVMESTPLRTS